MYQPRRYWYSYFSKALEFYLRVLFICEYPWFRSFERVNINTKFTFWKKYFFFLKKLNFHQILFLGGYWNFSASGSCHWHPVLAPGSQFVFTGPNLKFVFPSPSPRFVFRGSTLGPDLHFVFRSWKSLLASFKSFIDTLILDFTIFDLFFMKI